LKSLAPLLVACLEAQGIVVEALYLFGSRARRQETALSDIDVLVVSPAFASQGFWTRCARVGEALGEFPEPVQLYPVTAEELDHPEKGGFLESIRPDLKLLYRRRPSARQRLSATRR